MKRLLGILTKARPLFEEDGRLSRLKPVYDATEHFFFSPAARAGGAPFIRDPLDVKRFMSMVIVALVPCTAASLYFFGLRVVAMIAVSYAVGGVVEVLFAVVRKEEINEGFLVTGLIFPLILPPTLPLWMVGVGVAFGVLVGKELFGGTGRNLFNPALVGRCFLALSYPAAMTSSWIVPKTAFPGRLTQFVGAGDALAVTAATPLVGAKQGSLAAMSDLLVGSVSGSAGETSAIAVVIGGVFLLLTGVASWRTVAALLGSFCITGFLLGLARPEIVGPVGWHVAAGGLLFGAFFMATDPVTSPITKTGKWAYGVTIGVATVLIRHLSGYVEGVMFAILLGNIVAPVLDRITVHLHLRGLSNEG